MSEHHDVGDVPARAEYVAPRTPAEKLVADAWSSVLNVEPIGAHDDFFLLGGSSLMILRLAARIRAASGVELELLSLFTATTVEAQARLVERHDDDAAPRVARIQPQPRRLKPDVRDVGLTATDVPVEYGLSEAEGAELQRIAETLRAAGENPGDPGFYDRCWPVTERLPAGLRRFLEDFRRREPAAACLVHGFPLDDALVGPTPAHWETATKDTNATLDQEIFLALCGLVLGDPFTWSTLQSGRMIQSILPIQGDERRQNGHGSEALLEFHTEDGFHADRCDYLMLFGLRNHDRVPTLIASTRDLALTPEQRAVLSQPRFHILPDDEHLIQLETRNPGHPALAEMRRMRREPAPVAVLFGDRLPGYLRIDRPFMRVVGDDETAERCLDALVTALERTQQEVVVGPGTLLIVDNYMAVHGRKPFDVRYDGTDRWLKKLTVSRDLRRHAAARSKHSHRVLY